MQILHLFKHVIASNMSKKKKEKPIFGEWQLCPKCNGNKQIWVNAIYPNTTVTYGYNTCDLCNGLGVIEKPILNSDKCQ